MASVVTTAPTPTIVSSFALNPLTTTFTRPSSCSGIYLSGSVFVLDASTACLPSSFNPSPTAYYSPGLICPSGYISACHDTTGVNSVTTVTCCPTYRSDVSLQCVTTSTLSDIWSTLFCTYIAPAKTAVTLPVTFSSNGVTSTVAQTMLSPAGVNALGVRMVYQATDLVAAETTSASGSGTGSGTRRTGSGATGSGATGSGATAGGTTATTSGSASSSGSGSTSTSSSGLSRGATIAIAVVIPVVVLAALIGLWFCWKQRKRQTQGKGVVAAQQTWQQESKSDAYSNVAYSRVELPGGRDQPPELMGNHVHRPPAELAGSDLPYARPGGRT